MISVFSNSYIHDYFLSLHTHTLHEGMQGMQEMGGMEGMDGMHGFGGMGGGKNNSFILTTMYICLNETFLYGKKSYKDIV